MHTGLLLGHLEFISGFPRFLRKELIGATDTPQDFGNNYATGVYIDLLSGECKRIP